jgi:hypothetical protein
VHAAARACGASAGKGRLGVGVRLNGETISCKSRSGAAPGRGGGGGGCRPVVPGRSSGTRCNATNIRPPHEVRVAAPAYERRLTSSALSTCRDACATSLSRACGRLQQRCCILHRWGPLTTRVTGTRVTSRWQRAANAPRRAPLPSSRSAGYDYCNLTTLSAHGSDNDGAGPYVIELQGEAQPASAPTRLRAVWPLSHDGSTSPL